MEAALSFERLLLSGMKAEMVAYLRDHLNEFAVAVELGLTKRQPLAWRSVWVLEEVMAHGDTRILPYLSRIFEFLPGAEDGHCRQWLMVLHRINLPDDHLAPLFDLCMGIWCHPGKQPSVRYHAFLTMLHIADRFPELKHEIAASLTAPLLESLSPGIRKSLLKRHFKTES
ncbi:MAG: hypothetical protein C0424_02160 [Sphingobacteriaceae bacterium]|nr:hypothetical protein [Sphingobacteriaceae bacterium]